MAIRKVVLPGGKVDKESGWGVPQRKRVIPDWVASEVTRILGENMTSGTGTGAYFGKTSAGKTGTTDNFADAWFCGFTPSLEATIWKLFMERAIAYAPFPTAFPVAKSEPV